MGPHLGNSGNPLYGGTGASETCCVSTKGDSPFLTCWSSAIQSCIVGLDDFLMALNRLSLGLSFVFFYTASCSTDILYFSYNFRIHVKMPALFENGLNEVLIFPFCIRHIGGIANSYIVLCKCRFFWAVTGKGSSTTAAIFWGASNHESDVNL